MKNSQYNLTKLFKRKDTLITEIRHLNKDLKVTKQEQKNIRKATMIQAIRREET